MTQPTVLSLSKDTKFTGFLMVRMAEQRQSSKGDKYLDMTLGDATGDLNAKVWDGKAEPPQTGSVIKVRATVQEYNGLISQCFKLRRLLTASINTAKGNRPKQPE